MAVHVTSPQNDFSASAEKTVDESGGEYVEQPSAEEETVLRGGYVYNDVRQDVVLVAAAVDLEQGMCQAEASDADGQQ